MKTRMMLSVAAAALMGLAGAANAFHSGGVAECEGCHTMHNSLDGTVMGQGTQYQSNAFLLKGVTATGTCLLCHSGAAGGYHILSWPDVASGAAPLQFTPGGDFAWLKKTYTYVLRGNTVTEPADMHGHNVIDASFGLPQDGRLTAAPGGTYDASKLSCISCHDPHSKARYVTANSANPYADVVYPWTGVGSNYQVGS